MLFFTDPERTPCPLDDLGALPRGAGVVYRPFGAADTLDRGVALARRCRQRRLTLFVGADARLAVQLRALGLHLPQRMANRTGDIQRWRQRFFITAAAHDVPAVLRASRAGVQAIVVAPVFASASRSAGRPLGARRLAAMAHLADVPVIALGGVGPKTARRLVLAGVSGVAAVEAVARARAPNRVT